MLLSFFYLCNVTHGTKLTFKFSMHEQSKLTSEKAAVDFNQHRIGIADFLSHHQQGGLPSVVWQNSLPTIHWVNSLTLQLNEAPIITVIERLQSSESSVPLGTSQYPVICAWSCV